MGLRLKLGMSLLALLLGFGAYLAFVWYPSSVAEEREHYIDSTKAHLAILGEGLIDPLLKNDLAQIYVTLDSVLARNPDWLSLSLQDSKGVVIYPLEHPVAPQSGEMRVVLEEPVRYQGRDIGRLVLYSDLTRFIDGEMQGVRVLVVALLTALFLYLLMVTLAAEWLLHRPLRQLAAATRRLGSGDFLAPLPPARSDEIGELVKNFTAMRDAIASGRAALTTEVATRQKSEMEARASERQLMVVMDNIVDSIVTINEHGCIESFNRAAEQMFGYTAAEVLGRNVSLLMPEPHAAAHDRYLRNHHQTGEWSVIGQLREMEAKRRDGTTFLVELAVAEASVDGRQIFTGVLRDISVRRRAEEEMRRAHDAAIEAARIKSEFLANMSHEIRTPLNGVLGMLELLRTGALPPEQHEQVETAFRSGRKLLALLNDTLDFSKIEAGRMQLEDIAFDLRDLVESAMETVAPGAAAKNLELGCLIDLQAPVQVCGDPTRLRQVLVNLLGNAVKFTQHGDVFVSVSALDAEQDAKARNSRWMLRFEVTDTGCGISSDAQARIFDSFTQADGSTTRRHGGSGLGLAICKRLVEIMGGKIGVMSEPGRGSIFWFTVSLGQAPASEPFAPDPRLAGRRVLIAGDNSLQRMALQQLLVSFGMQHDMAVSAGEAVERLRTGRKEGRPFDVVLIDSSQPETEGQALLQVLINEPVLESTRIALLLPFGHAYIQAQLAALRLDASLVKPLRRQRLHDGLVELLTGQSKTVATAPRVASSDVRLLVAEDNPVNQQVIASLLKRLGYSIDLVADGSAAVERVARGGIDLVLMDCQMPGMDGYEATREIRRRESRGDTDNARLPVVAMTANAMPGDREKCLAAGMDDYLTKPIDFELLRDRLVEWLKPGVATSSASTGLSTPEVVEPTEPLDRERFRALRELLGKDLADIVSAFRADAPRRVAAMQAASSVTALRAAAHALKGSSINLGILHLATLCQELEKTTGPVTAPEVLQRVAAIAAEHDRVAAALDAEMRMILKHDGSAAA